MADIYILSDALTRLKRRVKTPNAQCIFKLLTKAAKKEPVFVNQEHALSYARFIQQQFCVVHAQVPDQAIISRLGNLYLKPEQLQVSDVRGLVIGCGGQHKYLSC